MTNKRVFTVNVTITVPEFSVWEVKKILEKHGVTDPSEEQLIQFFHDDVMSVYFDSYRDDAGLVNAVRDFWNV